MTLQFSRSLYEQAAIEATVEAFSELASFAVTSYEHGFVVEIRDATPEIDDLSDHFANHALHLSITMTRRAAEGAQQ